MIKFLFYVSWLCFRLCICACSYSCVVYDCLLVGFMCICWCVSVYDMFMCSDHVYVSFLRMLMHLLLLLIQCYCHVPVPVPVPVSVYASVYVYMHV